MSWKTPITLLVLLGVLVGAAYYGWQTVISPATDSGPNDVKQTTSRAPACAKAEHFAKGQKFTSKTIRVNVYNAGSIAGLADETLVSLAGRGFESGVADNAPGGVSATGVTVLTNDKREPKAQLVASQFLGRVSFVSGPTLAPGIDVIVGDNFNGLNTQAKKYLTLHKPLTICLERAGSSG